MRLQRIARGVGFAAAALVILAAVVIGSVRLLLPLVPRYQDLIQAQAQRYLGFPLQCERIDARWTGLYPELVLRGVTLRDPTGRGVILRARQVRLGIDPAALFGRRLRPVTLTLVDPTLSLVRDPDGDIHPTGVPPGHVFSLRALLARLAPFAQVQVTGAALLWWDRLHGAAPVRFTAIRIDLRRRHGARVLGLSATLPAAFGRRLTFVARWRGAASDPLQARGRFFVKGEGLALSRWTAGHTWAGMTPEAGHADLEAWGAWDTGRLVALEGRAAAQGLRLAGAGGAAPFQAAEAAGRFAFEREATGWWLRLADLVLHRSAGASPRAPMDLAVVYRAGAPGGSAVRPGTVTVDAHNLRLAVLGALLRRAELPAPWGRRLAALQPGGVLHRLHLRYRGPVRAPEDLTLRARFSGLSFRRRGRLPGVAGLDGRVTGGPGSWTLDLDSDSVTLDAPRWLAAPLHLTRLAGRITARRSAAVGWVLRTPDLAFANPDLAARARVRLELPPGGAPVADLQVDVERGRVAAVRRYLPLRGIPPRGRAWLEHALVGGEITSGAVLLRGPLDGFPYDDADGVFEARLNVRDVTLQYAPDWPRLEEAEAQVGFRGRALSIDLTSAKVFGMSLTGAHAAIPRLGHDEILNVALRARGPADDLLRVLRESPVEESYGVFLGAVHLAGEAALDFRLHLPLGNPRARTYSGTVAFSGATLDGAAWGLRLSDLTGRLGFDRDGFTAPALQARLSGGAVRISVATPEPGRLSVVRVQGGADAKIVEALVSAGLSERLKGRTDWTARLAIPWKEQGGRAPKVAMTLRSDLKGLAVELPAPFGKPAGVSRELELRTDLPRRANTSLRVHYGAVLDGVLRRERGVPGPGEWWYAQLHGPVVAGKVWVPVLYPDGPAVVMDLDRLVLPGGGPRIPGLRGAAPDPRVLPALRAEVREFRLGARSLGRLTLRAKRIPEGLRLTALSLKSPQLRLKGTGSWVRAGPGSVTRFQGTLESDDTGRLLGEFGFVKSLKGGKAHCEMDLHWPGAPTRVRPATLAGTLKIKITDGRLLDINPGAGRIFGLFSLQALPRRLSLDFSDLFRKGFTFDHIEGTFRLRNGEAYTDNLTMVGPAAEIAVSGRTGLVARDYDQKVTVTPNLGSSLPIAGTLAGGPAVGAALFLAEHLLRGPIRHLTRYRYTVTGSWNKPVITRISGGIGGLLPGLGAPEAKPERRSRPEPTPPKPVRSSGAP